MTVKDGKIVKATEEELYSHYLKRGFDDIMSFSEYMNRCSELGTKIIEKEGAEWCRSV